MSVRKRPPKQARKLTDKLAAMKASRLVKPHRRRRTRKPRELSPAKVRRLALKPRAATEPERVAELGKLARSIKTDPNLTPAERRRALKAVKGLVAEPVDRFRKSVKFKDSKTKTELTPGQVAARRGRGVKATVRYYDTKSKRWRSPGSVKRIERARLYHATLDKISRHYHISRGESRQWYKSARNRGYTLSDIVLAMSPDAIRRVRKALKSKMPRARHRARRKTKTPKRVKATPGRQRLKRP